MQKVLIVGNVLSEDENNEKKLSERFHIIKAADTREILSVLKQWGNSISAIVIDISITVYDEPKISEQLYQKITFLHIPVIGVVMSGDENSQITAASFGLISLLSKPYSGEVLIHMISNVINIYKKYNSVCYSSRDRLTGLLNRESFLEEAEKLIYEHEQGYYILSCFDIENFKVVNDQYGIEKGDQVLKHVAECVNEFAESLGGLCCRFMADNFGVLFPYKDKDTDLVKFGRQKAINPECINHTIKIRIGRYHVKDFSIPVSAMYDRATIAEESIRDIYDIYIAEYNESMRSNIIHEQEIVNIMYDALKNDEFEPWFQPQFNHATGAMIGSEALVRWKKDGKYISPAQFVPVFERNGFIYEMDQYIWESVCKLLRKWIDEGKTPLPVSVNISRRDLFHEQCVPVLDSLVKKYRLPYDLLRLEVTESAFSESSKLIVTKVSQLIKLGFTIEIDDFGSGYSSLNTLKDVPASILKLDMKFFENTENVQRGGNIIESVIRMARWLGMAVIAEGVEERSQADFLKSIGCYYIQGYFYAKPMPVDNYEELMENSQKEHELTRMKTLETLDNNEFWNPKSMETLIFNSYIGGACIFEFHNGKTELLRVNEQYGHELGYFRPDISELYDKNIKLYLDEINTKKLMNNIFNAIKNKRESSCSLVLSDGNKHKEYIRSTVRVIARTEERYLFYCVIVNQTDQRIAEQKQHEAEIKEMEKAQQLQVIMSNINGGVSAVRVDDSGKSETLFSNDKLFDLYGYSKQQAIDEHLEFMDLIIPEDTDAVLKKIRQLKKTRISTIIDYRCIKRDGRLAYMRANASLMKMNGYDDVITSVVTDITQQKEMADQLRAIIDNINGGVTATVIENGKPKFIVVNDSFYEILGFTKEQFEKECNDIYSYLHPDDRDSVVRKFEQASDSIKRYSMEYRIIRRDGQMRYIQNNVSVINIFGIDQPVQLAVMNDITDLRIAEQAVVQTNDRLNAVMNNAGNGITAVIMKEEGAEFLFANDMYYQLHGFTREEFLNKKIGDAFLVIHSEDRQRVHTLVTEAIKKSENIVLEYRIILSDESVRWIKTHMTMTRISGIDYPVAVSSYSDVTAEKESDEQLRFLNDSAHEILSHNDCDKAINQTLEKLLRYFNGIRSYVMEIDKDHEVLNNTYEICAPGVSREKERLQNIPARMSKLWFEILNDNKYVVIEDVDEIKENSELQSLLSSQGIKSLIVAPLWRDGSLIGFSGIDNPASVLKPTDRLMALSDYIAILITRRDLNNKIKKEINEQRIISENLRKTEMEYKIATQHSGRTICRYDVASRELTVAAEDAKYFSLPECIPDVPYGRVRLGKISSDTSSAYINFYEDIICGKKEGKVIFEKLLPVGWRWISAHSTTIFSDDGQPVSAVISYVDITEQQAKEDVFHKWQQSFDNRPPESYTFFRCNLSKNISDDSFEGKLLRFDHVPDPETSFDERTVFYAENCIYQEDIHKYIEAVNSDRLIASFYRGNRKIAMDYRELLPDKSVRWIHVTVELVEQPFSKNIMAYLMFEKSESK